MAKPDNPLDWDNLRYFLEVARTQRVSAAARRLLVEHTTVARRMRALEASLGTQLFEKSRSGGYSLTGDGQRLFVHAEQMESVLHTAHELVSGQGQALSGHVRIGTTEGFGSFVLTPLLTDFQRRFPRITVDVLPAPRLISLSKGEADLSITIEQPVRGPYVCSRLCDYTLLLYGTPEYLERHGPIGTPADLGSHNFIGYVDELAFSSHLRYLHDLLPQSRVTFRSTSVIAQYHAALQGDALAILPCFIAAPDPRLRPVLSREIRVVRSFWIYCHEELRRLKRVTTIWDFLREAVVHNQALLDGEAASLAQPGSPRP